MARTNVVTAATALLSGSLLFSGIAFAQSSGDAAPQEDPLAAIKTEDGFISITKAAPVLTPVSDYTGDIWERSSLFDDAFGRRQELYEQGVTVDAQVTQVVQDVTSGGPDSDPGARYFGLLDYGITLDTGKLGLWSGGLIVANGQTSWGNSLLGASGNLAPVNFLSAYPAGTGENDTILMEYYLVQALPLDLTLIAGRMNAANLLDRNSFANDPRKQFMNIALNNNVLFGGFVSFSTYGGILNWHANDNLAISVAAYDPNDQPGDYGSTDGFFDEVGLGGEIDVSWDIGDLGGTFRSIFIYKTENVVDFSNSRLLVERVLTGQALPEKTDNWMIGFNVEQYLWKPDTSGDAPPRTADDAFQERGIGVFGRFGYAPKDRNPYNVYASGGIGARGVFDSRPHDRFGIGVYWMQESGDVDDLVGGLLQDETGVEAYYNFAITPWLNLSADAQWIDPGITNTDEELILGLRLNTRF